MIFSILTLVLALIGLYISYYVGRHKIMRQAMVCSIKHDCGSVVNSKYGKTFGVENTLLGALYYGLVAIVAVLILTGVNYSVFNLMIIAAIGASLFSLYLIWVMKYKLQEWCDWCLASTLVTNLITVVYLVDYFI